MRKFTKYRPASLSILHLLAVIALFSPALSASVKASEGKPASANQTDSSELTSQRLRYRAPRTLKEAGISPTAIIGQPVELTAQSETSDPAPSPSTAVTYSTIPAQVGGSFTSGPGAGYDRSFVGLDGFVPLMQTPGKDLAYVQGRLLLSTDGGNPGGNVLLGYRRFTPASNSILGGYLGFDVRDTGRTTFSQLGAGVEGVWSKFEARLNGYLPVGDTRRTVDQASGIFSSSSSGSSVTTVGDTRFQGNSLSTDLITTNTLNTSITRFNSRRDQVALGGFDAEAGVKLAQWNPDGNLKTYLGLYYYSGSNVGGFVGVRGRLAANITKNFSAGLSVQGDPEFGTTAAVTVGLRFPGAGNGNENEGKDGVEQSNWALMGDSPNRSNTVAVTERRDVQLNTTVQTSISTTTNTVPVVNPATNQPYVFQHVVLGAGGTGTFESPFGTVAAAITAAPGDGNGIVYVQPGTNPGIPAFTIKDGVQVLSTAPVQTLPTTQFGNLILPLSGAGTLPTVTGTVTMGNNTTLGGFRIAGFAGIGITGTGLRNVTIQDNVVTSLTNNDGIGLGGNLTGNLIVRRNTIGTGVATGINLQLNQTAATPVQIAIADNTVSQIGGRGIVLAATGTTQASATITNNGLQNTAGEGIQVTGVGAATVVDGLTIQSNRINQSGADAINLVFSGGARLNTALIDNNTISNVPNPLSGIFVLATGAATRISSLTLSGNQISTTPGSGIRIQSALSGTLSNAAIFNNSVAGPTTSPYYIQVPNGPTTRICVSRFTGNVSTGGAVPQLFVELIAGAGTLDFVNFSVPNVQANNTGFATVTALGAITTPAACP